MFAIPNMTELRDLVSKTQLGDLIVYRILPEEMVGPPIERNLRKRVCRVEGCNKVLSMYNLNSHCFAHSFIACNLKDEKNLKQKYNYKRKYNRSLRKNVER